MQKCFVRVTSSFTFKCRVSAAVASRVCLSLFMVVIFQKNCTDLLFIEPAVHSCPVKKL